MVNEEQVLLSPSDIRCRCGQLVARWYKSGIQIKCKRCRRLVNISFASIQGEQPVPLR